MPTISFPGHTGFKPLSVEDHVTPKVLQLVADHDADINEINQARRLQHSAEAVDTKFKVIHLLEKSDDKLVEHFATGDREEISSLVRNFAKLSREDLATFSSDQLKRIFSVFLCQGFAKRMEREPGYFDLNQAGFNSLCQKLPQAAREALGWKEIPTAPYERGILPKLLGFPWLVKGSNHPASLHALNSVSPEHNELNVEQLKRMAAESSNYSKKPTETYFSMTKGLSEDFQNLMLQRNGLVVLKKTDLERDQVKSWLDTMLTSRCIFETTEPGVQLPNGLIARERHQAAIRRDDDGVWWLLSSLDPVATPVDFSTFKKGLYQFKGLIPRFSE